MKPFKIILTIIICVLSLGSLLFAGEAQSFEVNGLKVILKTNNATDIVAANLYLRGGITNLVPEKAGLENFALQVAQKATENYPKDKLNATLESMNTVVSTASGKDYSSFRLQCVKQNLKKSWEVFSDIVQHPLFADEDVELERQKILANIRQSRDDADNYLRELANEAMFQEHPYSISVAGTETTVQGFQAADLKNYLKNRIQTSNLLLVVVGHTSQKEITKLIEKYFNNLPVGNYVQQALPAVSHAVPSLKVVYRDLPTNYILGSFKAPDFGSKESYAMQLATSILRDRLFLEVRTKRSLSYAPASGYAGRFSSYGYIYVTAVDADSTIGVMHTEVQKLIDTPVTEKEVKNKVNVFITGHYMRNETNQAQADMLAKYELSGIGFGEAGNFVTTMSQITPEDIHNVCMKSMKNFQFVLLGKPASLKVEKFMF